MKKMKTITNINEYIKELIEITSKETGRDKSEIKINREAVKEYFNDGISPYFCFREEYVS